MLTVIPLRICNVFLLQGTRPILIDTGRPQDAARIERALHLHGVALSDLSLLLHTHGHWDHCGGTAELRKKTRAPVAIHAGDADLMRQGTNGVLRPTGPAGWLLKPFVNRSFPGTEPDLVIKGEMDLSPHGVSARVFPTPGHSAGSITILTAAGEAIIGDLLMGGYLGGKVFRRTPTLHYFAEDLGTVRASVRKVLDLAPKRIYPSHGGPLEPDRVKRWLGKP